MSYLNFDKTLLMNLERSLTKEDIRTNRAGAYSSSTLIDCNTRKYHGQLVLPIPELDDNNYILLSSLDTTVIQHGAEFNLGIHKYAGGVYNPSGHKYIRQFDYEAVSRTIYRVGGVVLQKERLLVSYEPRVLIRYTLLEAHSPTTLRFRPFLAFRRTDELTHENDQADTSMQPTENGMSACLYEGFPRLYMQFSKKAYYYHVPAWHKGIEYPKEQNRGFAYQEDLLVPGSFEMPMKKGDQVIFSAGITEVKVRTLKSLWDKEMQRRQPRTNMFACLKNSAQQFYKREGEQCYLLAGYPWFKAVARDEFFSLPACTLIAGRKEYWERIMDNTAVAEVQAFIDGDTSQVKLKDMDASDALLLFVRCIQQYAAFTSLEEAAHRYGYLVLNVVDYLRQQKHPRLLLHSNGLLYIDGTERPATWMNAMENGCPITPRTGYLVEINAMWYNALKFAAEITTALGKSHIADLLNYRAEITREAFVNTFWNGMYLYDYVVNDYCDREVRPNMIFAAGLPYSPLDRMQQKAVVDICTKELLTPKGLRTLSPKSGNYRPVYIGGQLERDRNYHNGPVWPGTISAYAHAYLRVYKNSGRSFIERILVGFEAEMSELCIGTLNELYDGNPPFKGHGGMSFARSVAAVLEVIHMLQKYEEKQTNIPV